MIAPPTFADYRHEALFYAGEDEFLARTTAFIQDGVKLGEPTLVVVSARKIDRLRRAIGRQATSVQYADMADVGANPARIIPAWREFVDSHAGEGRGLRGIGEPIVPERSPDELAECEAHEALLNAAFDDSVPFWLMCPYDTTALEPAILLEAERNHPRLRHGNRETPSVTYLGRQAEIEPFIAPLPDGPADASAISFDSANLGTLRGFVSRRAALAGFGTVPWPTLSSQSTRWQPTASATVVAAAACAFGRIAIRSFARSVTGDSCPTNRWWAERGLPGTPALAAVCGW